MVSSSFNPGFDIKIQSNPMGFKFGDGVFGPEPELRSLDSIRKSLRNPECNGPDPVYAIVMDVGRSEHKRELEERNLLYGAVTYAKGRMGEEPVRSQGHIHKVSSHSGWSPPELYEIWQGRAYIYIQEFVADDPGRCFAIEAGPGDVVVVPPGWAHATISADPEQPLTFGAWCDREYGFVYDEVRARGGLAWFPILKDNNSIEWYPNERYQVDQLEIRPPRIYKELGLDTNLPIYKLFEEDPNRIQWVSKPVLMQDLWEAFVP
jgi:glucose-6-phosphate isomerase, archaeal